MTLLLGLVGLVQGTCKKMKIILDSYTGSLVHLGVNKKEKIMKSRSFKTRKEFVDYLQGYGKYTGKPKIVKSIIPKFNSLNLFEVSNTSWHQVSEVLTDIQRLTLTGWYHARD